MSTPAKPKRTELDRKCERYSALCRTVDAIIAEGIRGHWPHRRFLDERATRIYGDPRWPRIGQNFQGCVNAHFSGALAVMWQLVEWRHMWRGEYIDPKSMKERGINYTDTELGFDKSAHVWKDANQTPFSISVRDLAKGRSRAMRTHARKGYL